MRQKRLNLSALLLLGLGLVGLHAQESVNSTGGNATGDGGSANYSIGQMVYTTITGDNGSVSQGLQQAFVISQLGVDNFMGINSLVIGYPNPKADYLTLKVKNLEHAILSF